MGNNQPQSKVTVALVCLFLGALGIHRLMMGYSKWWLMIIVSIVTLGFGGCLWALIDFVRVLTGGLKMADGQDLR
jgi:protein-S-isoprenylcysteine O-methyltransferase Ste14